jgi:hypothetical protein
MAMASGGDSLPSFFTHTAPISTSKPKLRRDVTITRHVDLGSNDRTCRPRHNSFEPTRLITFPYVGVVTDLLFAPGVIEKQHGALLVEAGQVVAFHLSGRGGQSD